MPMKQKDHVEWLMAEKPWRHSYIPAFRSIEEATEIIAEELYRQELSNPFLPLEPEPYHCSCVPDKEEIAAFCAGQEETGE